MATAEEWMVAKKLVPGDPFFEVVRFYAQQKADITCKAMASEYEHR